MNNDVKKVQPFDSFTVVYKILVWAGFNKPLNNPSSPLTRTSHYIYRIIALLFIVVHNVDYLIFAVQHRHDWDKILDCLMMEIPQVNLFAKVLTLFLQSKKLDKIHDLLNGPTFAATDDQDEAILRKNKIQMHRLMKVMCIGVTISGCLWTISFFVKRLNDKNETVNAYMPFETDTWLKFSISVLIECGPILWTGYGHLALDCLIATYYADVQTQLKMIKYQLQGLVTKDDTYGNNNFQYKDLTDESVSKRLIQIVKRYEKLVWYSNEVDTVFNGAMSVQFLSSASAVCLVIYRMTIVNVSSLPFLAILFCILLTQVFLYCYYGNLVEYESQSVNDSLYDTDWLSLSPSFRKLLLIAMCRWSKPIQPRVSGIIPLSMNTFISIVKSSYSLYTALAIAANRNKL